MFFGFNTLKTLIGRHGWTYRWLCSQASFPDNTYGVDSGGDPTVIPDLTFEQFQVPCFPSGHCIELIVLLEVITRPHFTTMIAPLFGRFQKALCMFLLGSRSIEYIPRQFFVQGSKSCSMISQQYVLFENFFGCFSLWNCELSN